MLNINIGQSNKDVLAKLMATENITVIHKKVPTAYFNVKSRTLVCPILKEDMSLELYDLFMGHEVGHALNTPTEGWHDAVCEKGNLFKGYLNVIEDCRIEEKIKDKYPGLRRSFYKGYDELAHDDFFGIKGKNLSKLNLIDKINIHFKIGAQARVQFSNEERPYIIRCKNLKNFKEVMELSLELFDRQKEITDEKMESMTQEQLEALIDKLGIDEKAEAGGEEISIPADESMEAKEGEKSGSGDGEKTDEESEGSEETDGRTGGISAGEQLADELNKSETDEEFRKKEGNLFKDEDDNLKDPDYFEIADKIKYDNFIIPWKEIDDLIQNNDFNRDMVNVYVKRFIDSNKKIISYMVKEFEMKKAAADYKRSYNAKSGEINMDKLHQYLLKDDIFNRIEVIPEGKNHGIVMIIDWSGSMCGSVKPTVEQAALLSMFCRRLQIPFRLFAFTDSYYGYNTKTKADVEEWRKDEKTKIYGKIIEPKDGMEEWELGNLSLLEIFNEKMSNSDFIRSMENWFQLGSYADRGWDRNYYNGDFDTNWYAPSGLNLGGTPLDASLVVMRDYLIDFKNNYGLDICSFITLTDGESHSCFHGYKANLVDRKRNKVFPLTTTASFYSRKTGKLLKWIRETAEVRTIGFFLTKATGRRFFREAEGFCGAKMNGFDDYSIKKKKEYVNLSTSFTSGDYDLSIIINQKKINIDYKADGLDYVLGGQTMETGVTKGKLKNALVKAGNNKMKQRVILNKFVDQMAI